MIVRNFIQWSQDAPAPSRADGARALARAFIHDELPHGERDQAEQALYALLDDRSPLVRRALAESLAGSAEAPPGVVLGLACDRSDVAAIVLSRSPSLTDAQLIDCAVVGDSAAQAAIAVRKSLSAAVSAALAEIGSRAALIALAVNDGANLPDFAMRRMIERFGSDGQLREALASRAWLSAAVRAALAAAAARHLTDFAVERRWLSPARAKRLAQDCCDRATMILAAGCADYSDETAALAAYLRVSGQLTAGLALRALLCGQTGLFEATLVELTGIGPRRVAGAIKDPSSNAFAALYVRAGLPAPLLLAFRAALAALARAAPAETETEEGDREGQLRLPIVQAVLRQCENAGDESLARLIALLRRFETEAAREKGRRCFARMKQQALVKAEVQSEPAPIDLEAPQVVLESPVAETAPAPEPVAVAVDEPEIVIDLTALEKDLIAA